MNATALFDAPATEISKHQKGETMMVAKLPVGRITTPAREDMYPPDSMMAGGSCRSTQSWLSLTNGYRKGVAKTGRVGKN